MSEDPTLVVYGDTLIEVSVLTAEIPGPEENVFVDHLGLLPGGSAANTAVFAARLGANVRFLGLTGNDFHGEWLKRDMAEHGVDVGWLRSVDAPTAISISLFSEGVAPAFLSSRGAQADSPYGELPDDVLGRGDYLHVSGYNFLTSHSRETTRALMAMAREVGATISLDPSYTFARQAEEQYPDALDELDYFFPNEDEFGAMARTHEPDEAARYLLDIGIRTVVLKLGAEGSLIASAEGTKRVAAYPPPRVVDTTGAGDAFAAGFLAATLSGQSAEAAAMMGHATAAQVVAEPGSQNGAPRVEDLQVYAESRGDERLLETLAALA